MRASSTTFGTFGTFETARPAQPGWTRGASRVEIYFQWYNGNALAMSDRATFTSYDNYIWMYQGLGGALLAPYKVLAGTVTSCAG